MNCARSKAVCSTNPGFLYRMLRICMFRKPKHAIESHYIYHKLGHVSGNTEIWSKKDFVPDRNSTGTSGQTSTFPI
jgi:hypothetical protein